MNVQKFMKLYREVNFPAWSFAGWIFLVGLLAYGVMLPMLGFYWDDWAKIAVARLYGLAGYWPYYAGDRPLSAWTHIVFTPLLGTYPLTWQIFRFVLTLLSTWGLYRLVTRLDPGAQESAAAAALLFLVYPVFTQHAAAVTFFQQWLQFALLFLSIGAMLAAMRLRWESKTRFWALTGLALVLMALQLSVTEYFAPLELIRPLLLWVVLDRGGGRQSETKSGKTMAFFGGQALSPWLDRLVKTAAYSAPYLLLMAVYAGWRFFWQPLSGEDPYRLVTVSGLMTEPLATLRELLLVFGQDSLHILIAVWGPLLVTGAWDKVTPFQAAAVLLSAVSGAVTLIFLTRFKPQAAPEQAGFMKTGLVQPASPWRRNSLVIGATAFLLGMLPAWLTGRSVFDDFHADRYALPALFGSAVLWTTAIGWLTPGRLQRAALVAILVGLGTGQQLRSANEYRWLWETETRFFWQLYWRVPHLKPGTALLSYQEIFPNQGLFSSSSALNLLYPHSNAPHSNAPHSDAPHSVTAPSEGQDLLPYWWYTLSPRYDINRLSDPIQFTMATKFRSLSFKGATPDTLLVHYDPSHSNCLWVITTADKDEPGLPALAKAMSSISNTRRIEDEPLNGWRPPQELFGPEPKHDWCYLYEKGDLARQFENWQEVVQLADQARAMGYSPEDSRSNAPREWLPFIEGYARRDRWADAAELTLQVSLRGKEFNAPLERLWKELAAISTDDPNKQSAVQTVNEVLDVTSQ